MFPASLGCAVVASIAYAYACAHVCAHARIRVGRAAARCSVPELLRVGTFAQGGENGVD